MNFTKIDKLTQISTNLSSWNSEKDQKFKLRSRLSLSHISPGSRASPFPILTPLFPCRSAAARATDRIAPVHHLLLRFRGLAPIVFLVGRAHFARTGRGPVGCGLPESVAIQPRPLDLKRDRKLVTRLKSQKLWALTEPLVRGSSSNRDVDRWYVGPEWNDVRALPRPRSIELPRPAPPLLDSPTLTGLRICQRRTSSSVWGVNASGNWTVSTYSFLYLARNSGFLGLLSHSDSISSRPYLFSASWGRVAFSRLLLLPASPPPPPLMFVGLFSVAPTANWSLDCAADTFATELRSHSGPNLIDSDMLMGACEARAASICKRKRKISFKVVETREFDLRGSRLLGSIITLAKFTENFPQSDLETKNWLTDANMRKFR